MIVKVHYPFLSWGLVRRHMWLYQLLSFMVAWDTQYPMYTCIPILFEWLSLGHDDSLLHTVCIFLVEGFLSRREIPHAICDSENSFWLPCRNRLRQTNLRTCRGSWEVLAADTRHSSQHQDSIKERRSLPWTPFVPVTCVWYNASYVMFPISYSSLWALFQVVVLT